MFFVDITGDSTLVPSVKAALATAGIIPVDARTAKLAQFTIELRDTDHEAVTFDSVDSDHERALFSEIRALAGTVLTKDAGGNRDTEKVVIDVPMTPAASLAVVQGITRAMARIPVDQVQLAHTLIESHLGALLRESPELVWQVLRTALMALWGRVRQRLGFTMLVLMLATSAFGQTSEVTVIQGGNSAVVTASGELQVNCTTGCGGGSTTANQGTAASTSDVNAWPIKVVFGGSQIDPRAIRTLTISDQVTAILGAGSSVIGHVVVDSVPTTTVTGTFWATTAGSPSSTRLSDGSAFYTALKATDTLTKLTTLDTITNPVAVTESGVWTQRLFDQSGNGINSTANGLWNIIRDAAGNARGANVNASNQLSVSVDNIPHVVVDSAPSTAVTNTGTFAVQCSSGCSAGTPGQATMAASSPVVIASDQTAVPVSGPLTDTQLRATRVPVDPSGVTSPISAVALPLPTLAATSTKQSDGTQKTQIVDGSGNVIGATSNALDVNIKSPTGAVIPASTDTGVVTRATPQEQKTTVTLGALNDNVSIKTVGMLSFGGWLAAGTCTCTITPQMSFDDGTTWVADQLVRHDTGGQAFTIALTNPNAAVPMTIYAPAGATDIRLIITSYTSGSVSARIRGSSLQDEVSNNLTAGVPGVLANSRALQVAGADHGNLARRLVVDNTLPLTTDYGAEVRVIPQDNAVTGTIGALNDTIAVTTTGFQSFGGSLDACTCSFTVGFQASYDNSSHWSTTAVIGPIGTQITSLVLNNPSGVSQFEFFPAAEVSAYRVIITAYTSGSTSGRIKGANTLSAAGLGLNDGQVGTATPFYAGLAGGSDGTNTRALQLKNSANAGTEYALITQLSALGNTVKIDQGTPGTTNGVSVTNIPHVIADSGSTTVVTGNVATTAADASNVTLGAKADAKSTATDTTAVTAMQVLKEISAMEQAPASRAVTNAGTFATQSAITAASGALASGSISDGADVTLGTKADAKSTATDTTAVSVMSVLKEISALEQAPASQAVTNSGTFATQSAITAASGALASGSIADGAEVTLGTKADAKSTATDTTAVTIMSVLKEISALEQAPASRAVTNAGTFAVQDTPPTLTKGTQGATGLSTQDLKDAGRSRITFTADRVTPAATDTLVTFVKNVAGTATTSQTTYSVTAAKTFRVQAIHVGAADSTTTALSVRVALRENTGGTCTASSAAAVMINTATPGAVAAEGSAGADLAIPDGLEFPASDSVCISAIGSTATGTLTISVIGYEY